MILPALYSFLSTRVPPLCDAIYPEMLPQQHPLPALLLEFNSDDDHQLLDGTVSSLTTSIVTVHCLDPSYLVASSLAAAVKNVLVGYQGPFGSYTAQYIYKESESPAPERETGLRGIALEFFIAYYQT